MRKKNIYELLEKEGFDVNNICDYCNIGYPVYDKEIWKCSFCNRKFKYLQEK